MELLGTIFSHNFIITRNQFTSFRVGFNIEISFCESSAVTCDMFRANNRHKTVFTSAPMTETLDIYDDAKFWLSNLWSKNDISGPKQIQCYLLYIQVFLELYRYPFSQLQKSLTSADFQVVLKR